MTCERTIQPDADGEIEQDAVHAAAVVDDLIGELFVRGFVASLLVDVIADEIDGCVGAAAGRREGADGALPEFAGAEVERQEAVRGGVGKQNLLPMEESARPTVATRLVLPTPPASEKTASTGVRVSFWRTGADSACSCPGCSKTPLRANQRAATRSRECCKVSATEDWTGEAAEQSDSAASEAAEAERRARRGLRALQWYARHVAKKVWRESGLRGAAARESPGDCW